MKLMLKAILLAALLVLSGHAQAEPQNRMWNSGYSVWQRGTSFFNNGNVGIPTADKTRNGPGTGGAFHITKETLSAEVRAQLATSPLLAATPRFAKKLRWTVAPTSGEGRIADYYKYFSMEEAWDDDVIISAGQITANKVCAWTSQGTQPFYMYVSQFMGWQGNTGKHGTGNTIIGRAGGRDYNTLKQEVFNRSHQFMMTTTPQCFPYVFQLDDLSLAQPAHNNGMIIGIGTDFDTLSAGTEVFITALEYDFGPGAKPWKPIPDELAHQLAQYRLQLWGYGTSGFVLNPTSILVSLPYKGPFKSTGPTALKLLNSSPRFQIGTQAVSAENAKVVQWRANEHGGYAVIDGFTGLMPGTPAIYVLDTNLLLAEYWH